MSSLGTVAPKISARVRILRAMMALDDHRSVQDHTVDELARFAQVAKGSVYYHFGSKDNLVREMLVHGAAELQALMDGVDAEGSSAEQVRRTFRARLYAACRFLEEYPSFTGLVAYALAQRKGDNSHQLRAEKETIVSLLAERIQMLERAEEAEGAVDSRTPRATLEIAATAMLSAAVTLTIERTTIHQEWSLDSCVDALLRLITR